MNKSDSGDISGTDWLRLDQMADGDVDVTDVPPLGEEFFERAKFRVHRRQESLTLQVDSDVVDWFKSVDDHWPARVNAALRVYMESHRRGRPESAA